MCIHEQYIDAKDCNTRGRLRQIRRNQRARSILDSMCITESLNNGCIERTVSNNQGLGDVGRCCLSSSKESWSLPFLGRSTYSTKMVSGNIIHNNDRPDKGLLMPSSNSRIVGTTENAPRISNKTNTSLVVDLIIHLSPLTVVRVVNYLNYAFQAGDALILIDNIITTPLKMLEDLPSLALFKAIHVPIKFWGGPPAKYQPYNGTLLTFMVDYIMRAWYNGQREIVEHFLKLE